MPVHNWTFDSPEKKRPRTSLDSRMVTVGEDGLGHSVDEIQAPENVLTYELRYNVLYIRSVHPTTGLAAPAYPEELGRLSEYDLCTNYSTPTIQPENCQSLCLPRTLLLIVAGVISSNRVIIVRVLRNEFRTSHFLELLVKLVLSVALDYAFNNRTS